jgi:DNA-binding PadR family transcriptional regulator
MTIVAIITMAWFFFTMNGVIDIFTSRKKWAEEKEKREKYWNSRKKFYLSDTDKANIAKLDTMIAEMKSIKKSIGGI